MSDDEKEKTQQDWFQWNPGWKLTPTRLAYEESTQLLPRQAEWLSAVEAKVTAVFALTSAVLTIAATVQDAQPIGLALAAWGLAIGTYIGAVVQCARAYDVRSYRVDPNPKHLLVAEYLTLTETQYRLLRLRDIADIYEHNRGVLDGVGRHLKLALRWAVAEIALVATALVLGT